MKHFIYGIVWRWLVRTQACPKPIECIEIKGLGEIKHLRVVEGNLVIVVDGHGQL